MNIKNVIKVASSLTLVLALNVFGQASTTTNPPPSIDGMKKEAPFFSGDVSTRYMGHYLSYRTGGKVTSGPMIWSEFNLVTKPGFYLSVFDSQPIDMTSPDRVGQQLDLALGKRFDLGRWTIKLEYRVSDMYPMTGTPDWHYQCLQVSRDMLRPSGLHSLRLGGYFEHISSPSDFNGGTMFIQGGVIHSMKLTDWLSVSDAHWFSYASQWKTMKPGTWLREEYGLVFKPDKRWEITAPGARLVLPFNGTSSRKFDAAVYVAAKFKF